MKKIFFATVLLTGVLFTACENKKEQKEEANEAAADSIVATKDTTAYGVPSVDTTTKYEKQHYGNGNTETSGNSGH